MLGNPGFFTSASFKFATAVERYRLEARAIGASPADAEEILNEEVSLAQTSPTTTDLDGIQNARRRLLRKVMDS